MRPLFFASAVLSIALAGGFGANARADTSTVFADNLSLGSSGAQVTALQQMLNRSADTRIASAGPGSPGNETGYFGLLTQAAVARFQDKYAREILTPAALARGNGYVGSYTRAKLNALSASTATASAGSAKAPITQQSVRTTATTTTDTVLSATNYLVTEKEKIDIHAGDAMLANVRDKIYAAINSAITSRNTTAIALPTVAPAEMPRVQISIPSPRSGIPGTRVSINGSGISADSVIYFGDTYVVRSINSQGGSGAIAFTVPPIPPGRYDMAVRTNADVSNTTTFVITDPRNPVVRIQSVSPSVISYGGTLTISGSGFLPQGNAVVTSYQTFTDVPSPDGTTLAVRLAPANLQGSAEVGDGTRKIPMSLYVVNGYGFSDSEKSFTMAI